MSLEQSRYGCEASRYRCGLGDSGPSEYKFIALGPELIHQLRLLNLEVHNHFAGIGARKETNKRFTRVLDPVMDSFL